jgi:hypothetical protein
MGKRHYDERTQQWVNRHYKKAVVSLHRVKTRQLDPNSPEAVNAAKIVGFDQALAIICGVGNSRSRQDAMSRRLPGSYGSRQ